MVSRSSSRSEGEYVSSDPDSKATKPPPHRKDQNVDRHSRHNSSARVRYSRSRSRSPYRASRGEKRRREDDSHRARHDPRNFGVRYDDENYSRHSSHTERQSKRSRTHSPSRSRSRSPYRRGRDERHGRRPLDNSQVSVSEQKRAMRENMKEHDAKNSEQKPDMSSASNVQTNVSDNQPTALSRITDEAALIEARRKRREAIKNKYRTHEPSLLVQALRVSSDAPTVSLNATPERSVSPTAPSIPISTPGTPKSSISGPQSPQNFEMARDQDLADNEADSPMNVDEASAADYDPTIDMQDERARHEKRLFKEDEKSTEQADKQVLERPETRKQMNTELDMFAEDDDDMFAESPSNNTQPIEKPPQPLTSTILDNSDDHEGYYITMLGELIDGRYQVTQNLGRGMFASVVRATDTVMNQVVAIKIIRNNESMRKAGIKEIDILQNIAANDPDDKMHMVRIHRSFDHKGHLCMVFENLSMNLREVLKKYGRDVGISLKSIRAYSQQLFKGLSLLKKCQLLHADLKPDNILVNESRSAIKICDLGSASPIMENATAPYLVSRFYRAPEIILGISYDYGIDMWSIGCTLFELYTGKILFTGRNNNNMLRNIMECRGKFPNKLLRKGTLTYEYFDDLLNFIAMEPDKVTGKTVTKVMDIKAKPVRDLRSRLVPKGKRMDEQERKDIDLFIDLLEKCLALSADKRITPSEALKHPFITRVTK